MKKFILIVFILSQIYYAQVADTLSLSAINQPIKIDSILISGNDITQEFIILREMTIDKNDEVDSEKLKYNRERIYSLGLFNYVNFYIVQKESSNILLIDVLEKWYLYPIPFLFFNEGEFKNPTYGISFRLENFRGRNESINAYFALGYDPAVSLGYFNPWFIYEEGIGFGFNLTYQDFSNKSDIAEAIVKEDFEYTIYSATVSFSKRLDQFNLIGISSGFSYIESGGIEVPGITATGESIDRVGFISTEYTYDSRDLKQFPKSGVYAFGRISHKGFGLKDVSYQVLHLDFRQYVKLVDNLTARWRATSRSTFGGEVPYYDYSFLGYSEYVRGHQGDVREGLRYFLGSVELSYTIIDEWDFSLNLPLLPKSLTSTRIGVNLNIFTDTGTAFKELEELKFTSFLSGYGVGLNILFLPFNSVRFEYALDEYMNGEFLIGIGFSF